MRCYPQQLPWNMTHDCTGFLYNHNTTIMWIVLLFRQGQLFPNIRSLHGFVYVMASNNTIVSVLLPQTDSP